MWSTSLIIPLLVLAIGGECRSLLNVDTSTTPAQASRSRSRRAGLAIAAHGHGGHLSSRGVRYNYAGCYTDNGNQRTLSFNAGIGGVTPETCQAACQGKGYVYSGTENGYDCYCGNSLSSIAQKGSDSNCASPCAADNSKICGGGWYLSIYQSVATADTPTSLGCFADNGSARTINGPSFYKYDLTPGNCFDYCGKLGYSVVGLENGGECFCGSATPATSLQLASSECSSRCGGEQGSFCGGSYRLNVYTLPTCDQKITTNCAYPAGYKPPTSTTSSAPTSAPTVSALTRLGCYSDDSGTRTLKDSTIYKYDLTPSDCFNYCGKLGYAYAGMENGNECFCSKTAPISSRKVSDSDCSTRCAGASGSFCGAPYRLDIYQLPFCTGQITSQCISTGTTTTSAATPTGTPPAGASDLGCYTDDGSSRTLKGTSVQRGDLTPANCLDFCGKQGFAYFGMENGNECYCGKDAPVPTRKVDNSQCSTRCAGASGSFCGAPYRLNIYRITATCNSQTTTQCVAGTSTSAPAPTATIKPLPAGLKGLGCFADAATMGFTARVQTTTLNPYNCVQYCSGKGYNFAGAQAGGDCYCSNSVTYARKQADSDCSTRCTGDSGYACGGASRLSVYTGSSEIISGAAQPASASRKWLWSHYMVGNTLQHTPAIWQEDIKLAAAAGIDGFALNMGQASYQVDQIASAYQAAASLKATFKLFFSFDMTAMYCSSQGDAQYLASLVARYASNPYQAYYQNKVLVTTFAGDQCRFGTGSALDGWNYFRSLLTKQNIPIYLMPSLFVDVYSTGNSWYDGHFDWDSAWPLSSANLDGSRDQASVATLKSKSKGYMANISPAFFTYYGTSGQYAYNKNWIYRSDNWLLATRFETLIGMRAQFDMAEITTWNDYGESHYIGPIRSEQPGSQGWVNGMPHTAWLTLIAYYAPAWKNGAYPTPTDQMIIWSRPHPKNGSPTNPTLGRPRDADWTDDNLYGLVILSAPADVAMVSGNSNINYLNLPAGLHKLSLASKEGVIGGQISRNGQVVKRFSSDGVFKFSSTFRDWNFNYFVQAL